MADETEGTGIREYVRLLLDRDSVTQLLAQLRSTGAEGGEKLAQGLQEGGKGTKAVAHFVQNLRADLDTQLKVVSKHLADNLIDEPEALRQADRLVNAFNRRLQEGLKRAATNNPELRGLTDRLFSQLQMPVRGQATLTEAQRAAIQRASAEAEKLAKRTPRPKLTDEEKVERAALREADRARVKAERDAENARIESLRRKGPIVTPEQAASQAAETARLAREREARLSKEREEAVRVARLVEQARQRELDRAREERARVERRRQGLPPTPIEPPVGGGRGGGSWGEAFARARGGTASAQAVAQQRYAERLAKEAQERLARESRGFFGRLKDDAVKLATEAGASVKSAVSQGLRLANQVISGELPAMQRRLAGLSRAVSPDAPMNVSRDEHIAIRGITKKRAEQYRAATDILLDAQRKARQETTLLGRVFAALNGPIGMSTQQLQNLTARSGLTRRQLLLLAQAAGTTNQGAARQILNLANNTRGAGQHLTGFTGIIARLGQAMGLSTGQSRVFATLIAGASKSLLAFASAQKLLSVGRKAIDEAAESAASWSRVSITMSDFGHRFSEIAPDIDNLTSRMAKLGYRQNEVANILGSLIQITGDYKKSLEAVPVVVDLSVGAYKSLDTAARLVGRAMIGDIGALQRHGYYLEKNRDALEQLSQRFGGEAAARAQTYEGRLKALSGAWDRLLITLGNVLFQQGGVEKGAISLADQLEKLNKWLQENRAGFQAIGWVIKAIIWLFGALGTAIGRMIQTAKNEWDALLIGFQAVGPVTRVVWTGVMRIVINALQTIAMAVDKVFGTALERSFDLVEKRAKELSAQAQAEVKALDNMRHQILSGRRPTGQAGAAPLAPDFPLPTSPASHIRAREHIDIRNQIVTLGRVALSNDAEASAAAVNKLNELLTSMRDRAEETKENFREQNEYLAHAAQIENVLEKLEKARERAARNQAEHARLNHDIQVLNRILLSDEVALQDRAARRLAQIEAFVKRQVEAHKGNQEQWAMWQDHLEAIQRGRQELQDKIQKGQDDEVKQLERMVELNIWREQAVRRLHALEKELTAGIRANTSDVEKQQRFFERLEQVRQALAKPDEALEKEIGALREQMQFGEMRERAEARMAEIREQLNKRLATGVKTLQEELWVRQQLKALDEAEAKDPTLTGLRRRMQVLTQLVKNYRTQGKAVEDLKQLESDLQAIMERGNITQAQRAEVSATIAAIQRLIRDNPIEPPNFKSWIDEARSTFQEDLPNLSQEAAGSMADAYHLAFTQMYRDARNWGDAVNIIAKGTGKALLDALGGYTKKRAAANFAEAIEQTAKGIGALFDPFQGPAAAATHFAAAAKFVAAGAAWGVIGGAVGSLGQSANTAYGNATSQFTGNERTNQNPGPDTKIGPDIHLHLDGVDPSNPRHQQLIGDAQREYLARYGGKIIIG